MVNAFTQINTQLCAGKIKVPVGVLQAHQWTLMPNYNCSQH